MIMSMLFRLLFAHILADFFFQTGKMSEKKYASDASKWLYLFIHSFIHAIVTYIIVSQWCNWKIPLVIFVTHGVIDFIKSFFSDKNITLFIVDQLCHIFVIIGIWLAVAVSAPLEYIQQILSVDYTAYLKLLIGYAILLKPTSIFMNLLLNRWSLSCDENKSLPKAGQWIGYLERILILTFILTANIEAIGFLLAAKSVFRFGDLRNANDIKTTEYIMLGTMTSFAIAIGVGFLIQM